MIQDKTHRWIVSLGPKFVCFEQFILYVVCRNAIVLQWFVEITLRSHRYFVTSTGVININPLSPFKVENTKVHHQLEIFERHREVRLVSGLFFYFTSFTLNGSLCIKIRLLVIEMIAGTHSPQFFFVRTYISLKPTLRFISQSTKKATTLLK